MDEAKKQISTTTDGQPPREGYENRGAPAPIDPRTGQHEAYWVLSDEERAKGFVRPVRTSYVHVGRSVCGKGRPKEPGKLGGAIEVCCQSPGHDGPCWRVFQPLNQPEAARAEREHRIGGCDSKTTMGTMIAETYARDPKYYGSTFCCRCREHFRVGEDGEFVWENTNEKVGT